MKHLLKYLEENKNPNLKTDVNYGFEYCLSLINEYQTLQLQQPGVSGRSEQFVCGANRVMGENICEKQCGQCEELYPQTNCH